MFSNKEEFIKEFKEKMQVAIGKSFEESSREDQYYTIVLMLKEIINKRMANTNYSYLVNSEKQVYYFSMEFLIGKLTQLYMGYLGVDGIMKAGLAELGIDIKEIEDLEPEAGLGNGGLGRLAACFMDSMASLGLPGHGCGLRFKYGLFKQKIIDGYQVELPDNWLSSDNVWEIKKLDKSIEVRFGGDIRVEEHNGKMNFIHENYDEIKAVPYDIPILGYGSQTVNTLRLWSAEAARNVFDLTSFSQGDHEKAYEYRNQVNAISEVLYPDDSNYKNKILRLKQEYFMVSAGLQSIIRRFKKSNKDLRLLPEKIAIHINDTHPALAIPEMMRILMDDEGLGWDEAWSMTERIISYTNHTILPEAMEKWAIEDVKMLIPRVHMIIAEINERFCRRLWQRYPGNWDLISKMSIISDGYVNMAHLAVVGSHSVNGVASIHTEILKKDILKNFYEFFSYKFNNKTNGITHRRWLLKANPCLSQVINEAIGDGWIKRPYELTNLLSRGSHVDPGFQKKFEECKMSAKEKLAKYIKDKNDIVIDTSSIFDVQVKRIHAYKRQLLNILHIMHLYNRIKENPNLQMHPRTFIFAGKAAPSYYYAKKIIKLINSLSFKINNDADIKDKLKVVFLEDYSVSLAEMIFPASDVSQQISTASKEASGTGNMKFMMNGAVTVGTMDGANIEIKSMVGEENFITFGLTADEVLGYYKNGRYFSKYHYQNDIRIKTVLDQLVNGFFENVPEQEFMDIYNSLLQYNDEFFVLEDFNSYAQAHSKVEELYRDRNKWNSMAIVNVAHSGKFSSDETINKYAGEIWDIRSINKPYRSM